MTQPFKLIIGNKNYSSWSLRAWLALKHFNIPFEEKVIALGQDDTAKIIQQYSPSGWIPVLITPDTTIWDSLAICEYLAELFPEVWASNTLRDLGYTIKNPMPEVILQAPWSCVYRFDTDQGSLYLKQVPPGLFREPQVIHLLRETCAASVPLLIADNPHIHCFLMHNADSAT